MKAIIKASLLLMAIGLWLGPVDICGQDYLPAVYIDWSEIQGIDPIGVVPAGGTITIPVRFTNVDEARTNVSNVYRFSGDHVQWGDISVTWNADYPWNDYLAFLLGCLPPMCYSWFDQGTWLNCGDDYAAVAGLTGTYGSGMPADFDGIAYYITITNLTADFYGALLTIDSAQHAGPVSQVLEWCWGDCWLGQESVIPSWGGPYTIAVAGPEIVWPEITSDPVTEAEVGVLYQYDVEATGDPTPLYRLETAPDGMTIDLYTGLIEWTPDQIGDFDVVVVAYNYHSFTGDTQEFSIAVSPVCDGAYTTCWPQPVQLGVNDNERVLNVSIFCEENESIDLASLRVFGKIPTYTSATARIEGDSIVTDVFLMRFLGVGGFRPLSPDNFTGYYFVTYNKLGKSYELQGQFAMNVSRGDVTFDGIVNIEDVIFMTDYLFDNGEACEFAGHRMNEIMDVDQNGRVDLRDVRALIDVLGG